MNHKIAKRILNLTRELSGIPNGRNKHFTFIVRNNRVLSVGYNDYYVTHPLAKALGYNFYAIHSELSAVLRYRKNLDLLKQCQIVNTRINRFGKFGMSKPCDKCEDLIARIGVKTVYYTNFSGEFDQMKIKPKESKVKLWHL